MSIGRELSAIIQKATAVRLSKTAGAKVGQRITLGTGSNAISAIAITDLRMGDAVAMQADDGRWYAFQSSLNEVQLSSVSVNQLKDRRKNAGSRKYVFLLSVTTDKQEYYAVSNSDIIRVAGLFDYEQGKGDVKISFYEDTDKWVITGWQKYKNPASSTFDNRVRLQYVQEDENQTEDSAFAEGEFAGRLYDYNTFLENTDDGAIHHFPNCIAYNGRWAVVETGYCAILGASSTPKVIAKPKQVAIASFYDGQAFETEAVCNPAGNRIYAQGVPFRFDYRTYFTGTNHQEFRVNLHEYTHEETFFINKNTVHTNKIVVREEIGEEGEYNRFSIGILDLHETLGVIVPYEEYIKPSRYLHGISGTTIVPLNEEIGKPQLKMMCNTNLHCRFRHIVYVLHEQSMLRSRPIVCDLSDQGISFVYTAQVDTHPFNKIAYTIFANYIVDTPTAPLVAKKYFCEYWYYQDKWIRKLTGAFTLGGVFPEPLSPPIFSAGEPPSEDYIGISSDPLDYPMLYYVSQVRPPDAPNAFNPIPPEEIPITLSFSNFQFIRNAGFLQTRKLQLEVQESNFWGLVGTFVDEDGNPTLDPDKQVSFWYHSLGGFFANLNQRQAFNYPVARFLAEGYIIYQQDEEALIPKALLWNSVLGIYDVPLYRTLTPVSLPYPNVDLTLRWGAEPNDELPVEQGTLINLGDIAALRIDFAVDAPLYRTPFPYTFTPFTPPTTIPDTGTFAYNNYFSTTQNYRTPDMVIDDQILVHSQRKLFATFVPPIVDNTLNIRAIDILLYDVLTFELERSIPELPPQAYTTAPVRDYEIRMTDFSDNPAITPVPLPPSAKQFRRDFDKYPIDFWAELLDVTLPVQGGDRIFGRTYQTPNEIALLRPKTDLLFAQATISTESGTSATITNCPIEVVPRYVQFVVSASAPPTVNQTVFPEDQFNNHLTASYSVFNPYLNGTLTHIRLTNSTNFSYSSFLETMPVFDAIKLPTSGLDFPFSATPFYSSFLIQDHSATASSPTLEFFDAITFGSQYLMRAFKTLSALPVIEKIYLGKAMFAFPPIYDRVVFPAISNINPEEGQIGKSAFYFRKPPFPPENIQELYLSQSLKGQKLPIYWANVAPVESSMPSKQVTPNWMTFIDFAELSQYQGAIRSLYTLPSQSPALYYLTPHFIPPFHFTSPRIRNDTARSERFLAITTRIGADVARDDIDLPYFGVRSLLPINDLDSSAKLLWKAFSVKHD